MSTFTRSLRVGFGWIPGIDTLGGIGVQIYNYANGISFKIILANKKSMNKADRNEVILAELTPWTRNLKRLFEIAMLTLCILGFVGALAFPLPGITPLVTLSAIGIAKACGITLGWALLARTVGALIGCGVDKLRLMSHQFLDQSPKQEEIRKKFSWTIALSMGVFGELGCVTGRSALASVVKWISKPSAKHKKSGEAFDSSEPVDLVAKENEIPSRLNTSTTSIFSNVHRNSQSKPQENGDALPVLRPYRPSIQNSGRGHVDIPVNNRSNKR